MKRYILCLILIGALIGYNNPVYASKTRPFCSEAEAQKYLRVHFNRGCKHYNSKNWSSAADEFEKVIYFFPNSDEAAEAHYFLGVIYFQMKEFDFANCSFSKYLTASIEPPFYEDAVYYKFCIAEHFRLGKKRRPLTYRYFPKWLPGETLALSIYDEVVVALPNHDLTVAALYAKGQLLHKMGNFHDAIDTYQTLIRRFPKNELTPDCYLKIAESYCKQSLYEFQNPDILALAELNVRKFKEEFPRDEKIETAEGYVCRIKEMYAKGLCDVGLFYERMCQPEAAIIYYKSSIEEFPDTYVAKFCRRRLICLGRPFEDEESALNEPACPNDNSLPQETETCTAQNEPSYNLNSVSFENYAPASQPCMEVCQEPKYSENRVYEELQPSMYQEQLTNYQGQPANWDVYNQKDQVYPQPDLSLRGQGQKDQELPVKWKEKAINNEVEPTFYEEKRAHFGEQPSDWCERDYESSLETNAMSSYEEHPAHYFEQPSKGSEYYPENPVFGISEPFSLMEQPAIQQEQLSDWCEYDPESYYYEGLEHFDAQPAHNQPSNWFEYEPEPYFDAGRIYQDQPAHFQEQPTEWTEFYPPYPSCAPVDLDYDINTNAIQEEQEAAPAPIFLHYSLLKKRQQKLNRQERRHR
ncbi:MAG: tetratricopeptide repeat protein [Candidatus Protochlamydia sp.]|nr:tetratricopeptide repeat protein [Candidatus Protochlamydia sp.]